MISKIDVRMKFRIITKNHATDSKVGFPLKIDFRAVETHEYHPTAWELNWNINHGCNFRIINFHEHQL